MHQRPDTLALIGADYDSLGGTAAQRKLIIFSAPRTGSCELCRLLTAAGIGTPHEYFNPNYANRIASRWGITGDPLSNDNIGVYIETLLSRRAQDGVFATKLQFWQYRNFLHNSFGSRLLEDAFFVHLYRPDVVRQFSSLRVSMVSGRWDHTASTSRPPQPDTIEAASSALELLIGEDAGFRKLFVLLGKAPLFVTTEDVVDQPRQTLERIGRFVGVDPNLSAIEGVIAASEPYERDLHIEAQVDATNDALRRLRLSGSPGNETRPNSIDTETYTPGPTLSGDATSPFDLAASDACKRLATRSTPNQATSVGVAMVRNEQDIIERFVRHNLRCLGKLIVIDHGSIDDTPRILQCLRDEGLPLEFFVDEDLGLHQADRLTRLARKAATLLDAHPLVPLDADEFLVSPSGDDIPTLLKEMPADEAKVILWRTYVPTGTHSAEEQDIFRRITNRSDYEPPIPKVIIGGGLAKRENFRIGNGSHEIVLGSERVINQVGEKRIRLAHFPIRSGRQIAAKVTQQRLAIAVTRNTHPGKGEHYRHLDLAVPISDSMTPAELKKAALMFCCPQGNKGGALIEDPMPVRDALRYLPRGEIRFLDIVEAFARDLARSAGAAEVDSSLVESLAMKENMELRKSCATLEKTLAQARQDLSKAQLRHPQAQEGNEAFDLLAGHCASSANPSPIDEVVGQEAVEQDRSYP